MSKTMAVIDPKSGLVTNIVICSEDELDTETQITYTDANPAFIGGDYVNGYFYTPQPYLSWTRDKGQWISPVPYPTDEKIYKWNEETQSWDLEILEETFE